MQAFISFHHDDRRVAGEIRAFFKKLDVQSFLAHEDIGVSREWQQVILEKLGETDLFVVILSARYLSSVYCLQESGIATFRRMTIIPLAIDESIPPGLMSHIQSRRINPESVDEAILFAGLATHDCSFVIEKLIDVIADSGSYRGAEANFRLILPYLKKATDEQIVRLLRVSRENAQVGYAHLVGSEYLPPLLASHGHLLEEETRNYLQKRAEGYK